MGPPLVIDAINDFIVSNNLDYAAFSETWLCNDNSDTQKIPEFTQFVYKFIHKPWINHTGCSVGVLLKSTIWIKKCPATIFSPSEHLDLDLMFKKAVIRLIVLYQPSPSPKNKNNFLSWLNSLSFTLQI